MRLGAVLRLGAEVTDISTDETTAHLADGTIVMADVIIGADGILSGFHMFKLSSELTATGQLSSVREAVLEIPVSPAPTGDMAYRAVFSREQLEGLNDDSINELCQKVAVTSWLGPEKHTVFYPVRGGQEFNLVLLRPDNLSSGARKEQGDIDEMRGSYADWDPTSVFQKISPCIIVKGLLANCSSLLGSLQKIISCVPSVYKWKLTHLPELESWTKVCNF
jgi:salicylate hydroxylase